MDAPSHVRHRFHARSRSQAATAPPGSCPFVRTVGGSAEGVIRHFIVVNGGLRYANPPSDRGIALFGITIRRRLAYSSRSSNSFAHIMFSVRETAAEQ
jgi:hypothetical protein